MAESVYKVIELIGTSKEFVGKGRVGRGQPGWGVLARSSCRRGR